MAKKPKRMTRKELRQQDEVMTKLQHAYAWLSKFKVHLAVGAAALVVVLLVTSAVMHWSKSRSRDVSAEFDKAFAPMMGQVAGEADDSALPAELRVKRETFDSEDAKYDAAIERLQAFISEHDGSDLADVASLPLARAEMNRGKLDEAKSTLTAYVDGHGDSPLLPLVYEQLGTLSVEQGKADEAATWFGKLVAMKAPYFVALGNDHLGDLANPAFGAAGDAEKARTAYQTALTALTENDRQIRAAEKPMKSAIERKLALLDVNR